MSEKSQNLVNVVVNDPQLEPTFFDFFLKMQKIHILLLFKSFAKRVLLFALFVLRFLATSQVANAPETCNYSQSKLVFSIFSCMFLNPHFFSNLNLNCSILSDMRNLQEQLEKAFCYKKMFWLFTVWINCSRISKSLQILGLQPRISKVFLDH